jgi:hypothetical protein
MHEYWRILFSGANGDTYLSIEEVALMGGGVHPYLHRLTADMVSASSTYASYSASHVVSGRDEYWIPSVGTDNGAWLQFSMGMPVDVTHVMIWAQANYPQRAPIGFALQWSDDAAVWTTSFEHAGLSDWAGDMHWFDAYGIYMPHARAMPRVIGGGLYAGTITGDVTLGGASVASDVMLIDEATQRVVSVTQSVPGSGYQFDADIRRAYSVMSADRDSGKAVVYGAVRPI